MPQWNDLNENNDLQQFRIELNRRLRYMLANVDVSQILFELNDIGGILNLSKGGTGASLSAPSTDSIMFYDLSGGGVDWLNVGNGLYTSGTTMYASGGYSVYETITASTTLPNTAQGVIACKNTSNINVSLSTAITTAGVSFFVTNASTNSNTVTLSAGGTRRIQYDASFILYPDENLNLVFDGTSDWLIR